jgi:hypothetical protein
MWDDDDVESFMAYLIDPPSPLAPMKVLRRFVRDYEGSRDQAVRSAVEVVITQIAHREAQPELYEKIEAKWAERRALALARVPAVASDEEARIVAAKLIAQHGGRAVSVAAEERAELYHHLGEDEAAEVWQRVIDAICELQPEEDRIRAIEEEFNPRAEAGVLLISLDCNQVAATQYAANQRDDAKSRGDLAAAERWQQVIVALHAVFNSHQEPLGRAN